MAKNFAQLWATISAQTQLKQPDNLIKLDKISIFIISFLSGVLYAVPVYFSTDLMVQSDNYLQVAKDWINNGTYESTNFGPIYPGVLLILNQIY